MCTLCMQVMPMATGAGFLVWLHLISDLRVVIRASLRNPHIMSCMASISMYICMYVRMYVYIRTSDRTAI